MEEQRMSEQESLTLIQQMIYTAKREQKDDGMGWIIWGWILFVVSVLTVLNIRFRLFQPPFFMNLAALFTLLYFLYETVAARFFRKTKRVKTYTGDLFKKLNTGFYISLFMIIISINVGAFAIEKRFGSFDVTPVITGFALLINLYAFWMLIYGTALNFKPSVIGAYCTWAIGFAALFVKTFEQVMLLHGLAALAGYIIPGHIANREFKKLKSQDKVATGV